VGLVRTDFSEESMIRVTRIGELGMLAVTSNRCTLQKILSEKGSVSMKYQIEDAERSGGSR
jgi:hypothetical protein